MIMIMVIITIMIVIIIIQNDRNVKKLGIKVTIYVIEYLVFILSFF